LALASKGCITWWWEPLHFHLNAANFGAELTLDAPEQALSLCCWLLLLIILLLLRLFPFAWHVDQLLLDR